MRAFSGHSLGALCLAMVPPRVSHVPRPKMRAVALMLKAIHAQ
jgi:hypothetical protein